MYAFAVHIYIVALKTVLKEGTRFYPLSFISIQRTVYLIVCPCAFEPNLNFLLEVHNRISDWFVFVQPDKYVALFLMPDLNSKI